MGLDRQQFTLLTPEEIPAEVYPYRRVWRSVVLEIGAMAGMVGLVYLGLSAGVLRDVASRNWGLLLVLVPLGVYLYASVRAEQRVDQPREGLLTVTLFSALLANGVGLPLLNNVFQPHLWLAEAGFFTRVLGYSFTVGVTAELLKYVAIRYTVWPGRIRIRMDGVAYSVAAAVGYATIANLELVFATDFTVTANALRIAINFIAQVSFGVVMGFFLAEVALHNRPPVFLAWGLFAGSFVTGIHAAFRGIVSGSGFDVSNFNGLLLVLVFASLVMLGVNFVIRIADSRDAFRAGARRLI